MKQKKLLLIDGSSYLYRAFHASPDLRTKNGFPTGAIHVMQKMIDKTMSDHSQIMQHVFLTQKVKHLGMKFIVIIKQTAPQCLMI